MKTLPPKILGNQIITQYGSTVYIRMAMWFCIIAIHKDFHFQFQVNLSYMDIKVENM